MKLVFTFLLLLLLLFFSMSMSGCVMYAPARGIPDGTVEARLSGSAFYGDTSTDDLADNFRFDIAALYGLTDRFQIGPMFEWGIGEVEIGGIQVVDREMVNFGLQALYCFRPRAQMTPYALVNLGVVDVDSDNGFVKASDDGVFMTAGFGLRAQVNEEFAVHGEVRATRRELDRNVGGDWSEFSVFLGCSYLFGRSNEEPEADRPRERPWRSPDEIIRERAAARQAQPADRLWRR